MANQKKNKKKKKNKRDKIFAIYRTTGLLGEDKTHKVL